MSYITQTKTAAPSAPATGKSSLYIDTYGRLSSSDASGAVGPVAGRHHNYLRNGGFWFAQRQTPGTLTTYSSTAARAFTADGWAVTNENASIQYRRVDTNGALETGMRNRFYGEFTKITNTGKIVVSQALDSIDSSSLHGRTIRVSIKAKQVVGASPIIRVGLVQLSSAGTADSTTPATFVSAFGADTVDPTFGTNLTLVTPSAIAAEGGSVTGNAMSCTLSSSWQRFSAVWAVPSDCKNLFVVVFGDAQFAAGNGFALGEVMLQDGPDIRDWNTELSLTGEFARCQRYYQKSFAVETGPAQAVGAGTGEFRWQKVVAGATATANAIRLPVRMRSSPAPTITTYNPVAANAQARDLLGAVDCTGTTPAWSGDNVINIGAVGNAATAAEANLGVHYTVDQEL